MFAPYCPHCRHRVLLGARRIVRFSSEARRHEVLLRCYCGTLVESDAEPPPATEDYRYDRSISDATSTARSVSAAT